jgi:hypothetical protein
MGPRSRLGGTFYAVLDAICKDWYHILTSFFSEGNEGSDENRRDPRLDRASAGDAFFERVDPLGVPFPELSSFPDFKALICSKVVRLLRALALKLSSGALSSLDSSIVRAPEVV